MRRLKANEIECRYGQKNKDGDKYSVLLYKTSRTDMTVLDEAFGPLNWKTDYQTVGNSLYCTISVWDKDKSEWVSKQSNGSESNVEAEKGQASDALKRAGFLWGIGRELYTAPQIWLSNKINQYRIFVKEIGYADNGDINLLVISDGESDVFSYGTKKAVKQVSTNEPETKLDKDVLAQKLMNANVDFKKICAYFKVDNFADLTLTELKEACRLKGIA